MNHFVFIWKDDEISSSGRGFTEIDPKKNMLKTNSLFVFPAQCNFSGFKYPFELIAASQEGAFSNIRNELCINKEVASKLGNSNEWFCLLDAASYVGTNQLGRLLWNSMCVYV